jgi:acyl-coenzyme A thioesterase PaaI-like protein
MSERAKQPNSRNCFVCGLENPVGLRLAFYDVAPDEVVSEIALPAHYQGYPGVVHGGIVASMLDEIVGRAAMGGEETRFMMTARLKIRYRKPVPVEQPLRLIGKLVQRHGKVTEARGEVWLPDGSLGAEAEAVLVDIPDLPGESVDWESLGWKVYPD